MLVFILIIIFLIIIILFTTKDYFVNIEKFTKINNFKAPNSFTKLKSVKTSVIREVDDKGEDLLEKYGRQLESISTIITEIDDINIIQTPSFFNCNEKWKGCLPRPLFQGTCGSCWGFAAVTALSSRFYIESCGNSGCNNYPQINTGSLDDVIKNINHEYGFKKDYLKNMIENINTDKGNFIEKNEWINSSLKYQKNILDKKIDIRERHMSAQILVYMLDFQSLGSIDLGNEKLVKKRAEKTYDIWRGKNNKIDIKKLQQSWRSQPISLSAEKLIACCTSCMSMDFNSRGKKVLNNPICGGGTLEDAWKLLRDTGTSTTLCIGYNLDSYTEGETPLSCKEIQGPYYSFCTGYKLQEYTELNDKVKELENTKIYPLAIPDNIVVPWIDPQLFRFRAKNAYNIENNMSAIQKEIMERGPVTTGFHVYEDFQYQFGGKGKGGQLYKKGNPLGSSSNSLIYMKDPNTTDKPIGGHAVTIVGWGTFKFSRKNKEYLIPYWTCLNSWGIEWGHSGFPHYNNRNNKPRNMKQGGYFWMVRGINNCGIEENVTCGQPNIQNISFPGIIGKYGWGTSPPSSDDKNVKFLPMIDIANKKLSDSSRLEILPAEEGGGTYIDYIPGCSDEDSGMWQIKSMDKPSPYLMFWPKNRPIYCIGTTKNKLSKTETNIKITETTMNFINILRKVVKNPILLLGEEDKKEQIQVVGNRGNTIIVNRSVNYTDRIEHKKYTQIKVFPYNNLSDTFLKNEGFYPCSIVN